MRVDHLTISQIENFARLYIAGKSFFSELHLRTKLAELDVIRIEKEINRQSCDMATGNVLFTDNDALLTYIHENY